MILNNNGKKSFSYETKASKSFIPNEENEFMVPNHERKGHYYENPHISHYRMNFASEENGRKTKFLNETKASISFILMRKMSL